MSSWEVAGLFLILNRSSLGLETLFIGWYSVPQDLISYHNPSTQCQNTHCECNSKFHYFFAYHFILGRFPSCDLEAFPKPSNTVLDGYASGFDLDTTPGSVMHPILIGLAFRRCRCLYSMASVAHFRSFTLDNQGLCSGEQQFGCKATAKSYPFSGEDVSGDIGPLWTIFPACFYIFAIDHFPRYSSCCLVTPAILILKFTILILSYPPTILSCLVTLL
ncbi:hypothetical protein C8J56DRAFT_457975 [Mycena floridula]|nr:hypothetical protein C8J56DRAFT_457975 [Mycena floridula]